MIILMTLNKCFLLCVYEKKNYKLVFIKFSLKRKYKSYHPKWERDDRKRTSNWLHVILILNVPCTVCHPTVEYTVWLLACLIAVAAAAFSCVLHSLLRQSIVHNNNVCDNALRVWIFEHCAKSSPHNTYIHREHNIINISIHFNIPLIWFCSESDFKFGGIDLVRNTHTYKVSEKMREQG